MTFETDLRAMLHERVAPITASPRLRAVEYHARTRRVRPLVALGGGIASGATGIAAVLLLAGGASSAFAGWTAAPTAPNAAQLTAADTYCAAHTAWPGLPLQLTDERGPFTVEVHADATTNDFCITGPSFTNTSGFSTSPPVDVPAGSLFLWSEQTATHDAQAYGYVIAQAAHDVSAATLTLDDGTEVTATVQNGWAVAWWPGSHQVASAQLTTPTGTQTQTFPQSTCGLHKCTGGPHGGGPHGGPGGD